MDDDARRVLCSERRALQFTSSKPWVATYSDMYHTKFQYIVCPARSMRAPVPVIEELLFDPHPHVDAQTSDRMLACLFKHPSLAPVQPNVLDDFASTSGIVLCKLAVMNLYLRVDALITRIDGLLLPGTCTYMAREFGRRGDHSSESVMLIVRMVMQLDLKKIDTHTHEC